MPVEVEVGMFELQAQVLKTRVFDAVRHMEVPTKKCRMCGKINEDISHIVAGCKGWNFSYYLERHDSALRPLCWWLRWKYGIDEVMKPWHMPVDPDPFVENDRIAIWWDMHYYAHGVKLEHNKPDMRVWLKEEKKMFVVEMSTPWDDNVVWWEAEKVRKYGPLLVEMAVEFKGRGVQVEQVTLVIGALGSMRNLMSELGKMIERRGQVKIVAERMQRATITKTLKAVNKFKAMRA